MRKDWRYRGGASTSFIFRHFRRFHGCSGRPRSSATTVQATAATLIPRHTRPSARRLKVSRRCPDDFDFRAFSSISWDSGRPKAAQRVRLDRGPGPSGHRRGLATPARMHRLPCGATPLSSSAIAARRRAGLEAVDEGGPRKISGRRVAFRSHFRISGVYGGDALDGGGVRKRRAWRGGLVSRGRARGA